VTAHLSPRGEHFLKGSPTLQDGQAQLHSIGLLEGTWTIARDDLTSFPEKPVFYTTGMSGRRGFWHPLRQAYEA
jgi:hypothetical protein